MALGRNFLKGMGLTDEQVTAIIDAHAETTDALKGQRDGYKKEAESLKDVQKELDELKANSTDVNEWKDKFEKEQKAFKDFKDELEANKAKEAKYEAYKSLLKEANVSEKLIELVVKANAADIEKLELDEEGKIKTADELKTSITTDYADYITSSDTAGAGTNTPPGQTGGDGTDLGKLSMEDYIAARKK